MWTYRQVRLAKSYLNSHFYQVNGVAFEVRRELGPGLPESGYHACMKQELFERGIRSWPDRIIPVSYKGIDLDVDLRCDLFIENLLAVELTAVARVLPVHAARLMTYMKLLQVPDGLLINFYVSNIFKEG